MQLAIYSTSRKEPLLNSSHLLHPGSVRAKTFIVFHKGGKVGLIADHEIDHLLSQAGVHALITLEHEDTEVEAKRGHKFVRPLRAQ